ncbi:hypothetical protein ONE63_004821 [Megalurothrips usitatus]|uniref:Uncharacterized protein n=1 Tax=Megalurothrips usitatus TaxID=439358 RepID=A0AAV7X4X3_9NEOP|nr:hypothetical protein ONE63_004821 [Megalurothrips usitatus]
MQWTGFPAPVEPLVPAALPTTTVDQVVMVPRFEASCTAGCASVKTGAPHRESNPGQAEDAVLQALAPMDRSQLYELIPGWSEDRGEECDEDGEEEYEDGDDDMDVWEAAVEDPVVRGAADPVVDASYRACITEAERYLVQCEGFDAQGSVVRGLRQHLHLARVEAAGGGGGGRAAEAAAARGLPVGRQLPAAVRGHSQPS